MLTERYNYIFGLQKAFFEEPACRELRQEISELHRELSAKYDRDNQKKLLKLVDKLAELRDQVSISAFASGIRLALGIVAELGIEEPYDFEAEEVREAVLYEKKRKDDSDANIGRGTKQGPL